MVFCISSSIFLPAETVVCCDWSASILMSASCRRLSTSRITPKSFSVVLSSLCNSFLNFSTISLLGSSGFSFCFLLFSFISLISLFSSLLAFLSSLLIFSLPSFSSIFSSFSVRSSLPGLSSLVIFSLPSVSSLFSSFSVNLSLPGLSSLVIFSLPSLSSIFLSFLVSSSLPGLSSIVIFSLPSVSLLFLASISFGLSLISFPSG